MTPAEFSQLITNMPRAELSVARVLEMLDEVELSERPPIINKALVVYIAVQENMANRIQDRIQVLTDERARLELELVTLNDSIAQATDLLPEGFYDDTTITAAE